MPISSADDVGELFIIAGQALTSSLSPSSSVSSSSSPPSSTINITTTANGSGGTSSLGGTGKVVVGVNNQTLRQYSTSHQRRFHRRFPAIDQHEKLIDWYSCALVADILLQGYLYISENYFAFYSNILGYKTQLLIPICDVISVTKEKTAKIFPNAVGICTDQTKYVFGSLLSRESTFRLMQEVWKSTLIQVVSLPYFSPVIQFDKIIKRGDGDTLIEKPEEILIEEEEEDDDDDDEEEEEEEEAESVVTLTTEPLNPSTSTNNNGNSSSGVGGSISVKKSNTQPTSGLIFNTPCIEPHHPETIKLVTSEITSIQKILSSTTHHHQRPNETDSSGSDSDANRNPVVYQDTCTNLINEPTSSATSSPNFRLSHKKRQSITLPHYGSNWIIKAKNWLTTAIRPYQRILWNQITDTTRLLVMTTTLLIMLFLSALIFLYRVEQVHSELLSLQQNTETNDFNQVQSKQIELRKEIKRLVNSLEEKTAELSLLKERIEEILNSYNHLSTCST